MLFVVIYLWYLLILFTFANKDLKHRKTINETYKIWH